MTTSRRFGAVVFAGPARTSKTEPLILNTIGHRIVCNPRDMLVVCSTQDVAKQFSERKLAPMIRANSSIAERQMTGRGSDNIHEKRFAGNMNLQIRWPVIGYFSQNEYFDVLLTDYDRMPEDVDGEGAPFMLARKRTQHAGSQGMVICELSGSVDRARRLAAIDVARSAALFGDPRRVQSRHAGRVLLDLPFLR